MIRYGPSITSRIWSISYSGTSRPERGKSAICCDRRVRRSTIRKPYRGSLGQCKHRWRLDALQLFPSSGLSFRKTVFCPDFFHVFCFIGPAVRQTPFDHLTHVDFINEVIPSGVCRHLVHQFVSLFFFHSAWHGNASCSYKSSKKPDKNQFV